jgi:hypothetical protein
MAEFSSKLVFKGLSVDCVIMCILVTQECNTYKNWGQKEKTVVMVMVIMMMMMRN